MTKDHFISQTYLKAFCSSDKPNHLNIYKKDRPDKPSYSSPKNVCYEINGDINTYVKDSLSLRKLLASIEPRWPNVIRQLREKKLEEGTIELIVTYLAYLRLCTPTAKKYHQSLMEQELGNIIELEARYGKLKADTTTSLLTEGQVTIPQDFANAPALRALVPLS